MKFFPTSGGICLLALVCAVSPLRADDPPKKLDLTKIKTSIDDVVVPVPSEIFNVLDKLGHPNWLREVRVDDKTKLGATPHIALLFGTVIADGFLAVQARDAERVKKIGRRVLDLSTALAVNDVVKSHCQSIMDAADASDWSTVRTELDKTQGDVKTAMEKLHNKDASELVSIGGWLRGTEALTNIVRQDYNVDRAELLHQPDLLTTFDRQLTAMDRRTRSGALVPSLQAGLSEMRPLIASNGDIDKESVEKVNGIANKLVRSISTSAAVAIP